MVTKDTKAETKRPKKAATKISGAGKGTGSRIPGKPVKAPTKRQLQANASKKKIFMAAQSLFSKYGYDDVTVADVCKKAGVSVGLFYNYFSSKADIALESRHIIEQEYIKGIGTFTAADTATDRIVKFVQFMLNPIATDKYMLQNARVNYIREAQGIPPLQFDSSRMVYQLLLNIVREGQKSGQLTSDINEHVMVRIIYSFAVGSTIHLINEENKQKFSAKVLSDVRIICRSFEP